MTLSMSRAFLLAVTLVLTLAAAFAAHAAGQPLVVYTARKYQLVDQLFQEYGRERGIEVKFVTDDGAPLIARLAAEGRNSPADLLITVDAGDLWRATEAGLLQPVKSPMLEAAIPAHLRDPQGHWFGLAVRARTIAYSTARVKPAELSTYAALGDPRWKGRLCLRSGKHAYNQSLVAMMIGDIGEEAAERVVRSWIANLAAEPFSSDTLMLKAVAAGQCDVAITNSYYLGRLQAEDPAFPVQIFWADQGGRGTHVNVSGGGVTKHAKNRAEAIRFLEWLASPEIQQRFAAVNYEFPANAGVPPLPTVAAWGSFEPNLVNVGTIGRTQPAAVKLMDRAGWR
ncbi:MAG: Fe(3+) ABC transporter substrate-binding protein [Steroidobacteraceae bacterium]|nr:Fe(3+) ABC transporter substrate-binding protein [Steroidobacteraceae bacterium]